VNQAKPILAQFALSLANNSGDVHWLSAHFDALLCFFRHWGTKYRSHCGLLVWGSDVGIGVDNDPATYGRPDFSSASLLLNCLYSEDLQAASILAARLGRDADSKQLQLDASRHLQLIQEICWDTRDQCFYAQDVLCADHRAEKIPWAPPGMPMEWASLPIRIQGFTSFLPLWCGAATPEQAEAMRKHLANSSTFGSPHGVRTLSEREPMYSLAKSGNPSNWLGPIWILANYFVWKALLRYGFEADAKILAVKTVTLLEKDARSSGSLHEYYHPETGEPLMNRGFLSWNMLALEMEC
jgi:putative isomerase